MRGRTVGTLLAGLQYIVDELHAFLGTEWGAQVRSVLHRVDLDLRRRVPRVGLSATLGVMSLAADALRLGEAAAFGVFILLKAAKSWLCRSVAT
jgi:ATP-dependent Lhr-like helicase